MPQAEVEAVIPFACWARLRSPVLKISRGGRFAIFVIAQGRPGPILEVSPGGAVTVLKFLGITALVRQVAGSEDRARNLLDQLGGGFGTVDRLATGDVAGANEHVCLRPRAFLRRFVRPLVWVACRTRGLADHRDLEAQPESTERSDSANQRPHVSSHVSSQQRPLQKR